MEDLPEIPRRAGTDSFLDEAIDAGVVDSHNLEFRVPHIKIKRHHEHGSFGETQRIKQAEIFALETKLKELQQDYVDAVAEYGNVSYKLYRDNEEIIKRAKINREKNTLVIACENEIYRLKNPINT